MDSELFRRASGPQDDEGMNPMDREDSRNSARSMVRNSSQRSFISRMSSGMDLSTGRNGGAREHVALVRRESESQPMGAKSRRNRNMKKAIGMSMKRVRQELDIVERSLHGRLEVHKSTVHVSEHKKHAQNESSSDSSVSLDLTQYRLKARKANSGCLRTGLAAFGCASGEAGRYDDADSDGCVCLGVNPNNLVTTYLHWSFRSSFLSVFFSAAIGFFGFSFGFAFLMMLAVINNPECLHVNGEQFSAGPTTFYQDLGDAFALSWTTFTTVGYGLVYPSVSSIHANQHQCVAITILSTLESFVGILFGSFCGAVIFGKVARIRSHAQVLFSDAIVIRYGTGVMAEHSEAVDDGSQSQMSGRDEDIENPNLSRHIPCPVLEFRVVNRLHATLGGEIIDGTMNIVASIDEHQASPAIRRAARRGFRRRGRRRRKLPHHVPTILESREMKTIDPQESFNTLARTIREHARRHHHQAFDEDPTGRIVPRRIFSKLEIESPDHPFFKRQWIARHVLDATSPLLTEEARKIVRLNNGFWPKEMDDHESVHASIQFDQILVSLSGTSNVDANSVYAQKVYDYEDINVGYSFVNILYRNEDDGHLLVDPTKINDVTEQYGGGGEPLVITEKKHFTDMLVL